LGVTSGSYWIGQFPIQIAKGGASISGEAYCLNYTRTIYEGSTYQADIAISTDISINRFITVMPESAIVVTIMIVAFAAAFPIYFKLKQPKLTKP